MHIAMNTVGHINARPPHPGSAGILAGVAVHRNTPARMPAPPGSGERGRDARGLHHRGPLLLLLLLALLPFLRGQEAGDWRITNPAGTRFLVVDILVDSGAQPLAAYQLDVAAAGSDAKIVGIEGGDSAAFREPPYYDPEAIQHERVILAAFQTTSESQLPKGKTRVATLHLQVKGAARPKFTLNLQTAATIDGRPIPVQASLTERSAP